VEKELDEFQQELERQLRESEESGGDTDEHDDGSSLDDDDADDTISDESDDGLDGEEGDSADSESDEAAKDEDDEKESGEDEEVDDTDESDTGDQIDDSSDEDDSSQRLTIDPNVQVPVQELTSTRRQLRKAQKAERESNDRSAALEAELDLVKRQAKAQGVELSVDAEFTDAMYQELVNEGREAEANLYMAMSNQLKEMKAAQKSAQAQSQAAMDESIQDALDTTEHAGAWQELAQKGRPEAWDLFIKYEKEDSTQYDSLEKRFKAIEEKVKTHIKSGKSADKPAAKLDTGKPSKGKRVRRSLSDVSGKSNKRDVVDRIKSAGNDADAFEEYTKATPEERAAIEESVFGDM